MRTNTNTSTPRTSTVNMTKAERKAQRAAEQLAAKLEAKAEPTAPEVVLDTPATPSLIDELEVEIHQQAKTEQPEGIPAPVTAATPAKVAAPRYAKDVPADASTPVVWQQTNPKKSGSASWLRYEAYKAAKTLGEAKALGALRDDVRWDAARGFVTITTK